MGAKRKGGPYEVVDCSEKCWANPQNLGEHFEEVHSLYEAGNTDDSIVLHVRALGFEVSTASVSRHYVNHLRPREVAPPETEMSDLEILRAIIKQGARHIPTWKLGPRETMQALDMYYKLTQGSAMADLFATIAAAANRGSEPDEVDLPAAMSESERVQT